MTRQPAFRLAALLMLGVSTSHAAEIRGVALAPDGAPVDGAQVSLDQVRRGAWTDAGGAFTIRNVTAGTYTLRVIANEFEPLVQQVSVKEEGEMLRLALQFASLRSVVEAIEVVGTSEEALAEIPGSVFSISAAEVAQSKPMDANEVLRRVPGVTVREDSGPVGMRLNIGIRGLNPDRSRQVLILEDGLPVSLAPYGEPEMYYSPPIDRMERIEVLKGSGQIAYGPQTIGGVINFVTPNPPQRFHGDIDLEGGQRGLFFGRASVGSSNKDQSAGWLLSYLHKQADGWRSFYFDINDAQAKFTLKPDDRNTFAIKAGFYDEGSNSTYLGLTQPMFDRDPNQNPVPGDFLKVRRESGSIVHSAALSPNILWSSSGFAYHTRRDWTRQDFDRTDVGAAYRSIAGDPSIPGGAVFLRDSAGPRNREFWVAGAQTGAAMQHGLFGLRNKLDFGLRYVYEQMNDKRIDGAGFRARTGAIREDEDRFGRAFSAYAQNRFFLGRRVIFTPGVRLENYEQERHILRQRVSGVPTNVDIRNVNTTTKAIPGAGLSVRANDWVTLFTGIHRGFAPPITKVAITSEGENLDLDAELSWNYEAGVRLGGTRAVRGEFTLFRMDFANQIIPAAQSGGATTTLVNAGETLHEGVESNLRVNWNELIGFGSWTVFTDVRHSHTARAVFTRNALFEGNRLPYAPRNTFGFMVGASQRRGLGFQLDLSHIGEQFADNAQTVAPSMDGTIGLIPSYQVANVMVEYKMRRERFEFNPYFTVKNLFDELYIASRAPQGIQPGMFRQANLGLRFSF